MVSNQNWVSLNGYDHEMTLNMEYVYIYVFWVHSNKLTSSLIQFLWSIAQLLKICPLLKIWVSWEDTIVGWSNLFGLVWNLVCMPYTYDTSFCTSFMRIWWGILQFWSGSCQCMCSSFQHTPMSEDVKSGSNLKMHWSSNFYGCYMT